MKKIIFIIAIIISLLIIKNLVFSIYGLWQKQDLFVQAQKETEKEKKRNAELKSSISIAKSPQFIEEQARNKLFLVKPGESEIILPKSDNKGSSHAQPQNIPNWEKWFRLFFDQL